MKSRLNPYLNFPGTARQAMERYQGIFGGSLTMHTYGEYAKNDPETDNRIMHAQLETDQGFVLMGADLPPGESVQPGNTITVSLSGQDAEQLRGFWSKLSEGGSISVPLEKQMWGDEFGACTDQFGIAWMVDIGDAS